MRMVGYRDFGFALLAILSLASPPAEIQDRRSLIPESPELQQTILDDPSRPDSDRERDDGSKPTELYDWLGIKPGMTVGDIIPGGGYNTHLLSLLLGESGRVLAAYNTPNGATRLEERTAAAGLSNVTILPDLLGVPDNSVDLFLTVRNFHDLNIPAVHERFGLDRIAILRDVHRTLKPGGILGVVDARTTLDGVDANAHRINEQMVIDQLVEFGFEYVEQTDLLRVDADDHSNFADANRWDVDRFALKFRKPSS